MSAKLRTFCNVLRFESFGSSRSIHPNLLACILTHSYNPSTFLGTDSVAAKVRHRWWFERLLCFRR
jgi:hypothetical protein